MICRLVHLGKCLQCSVITTHLDKCKERRRGQTLKQRGGSETFQPGIESVEVLGTFVIFFFLGTISTDIVLKGENKWKVIRDKNKNRDGESK